MVYLQVYVQRGDCGIRDVLEIQQTVAIYLKVTLDGRSDYLA